MEFKSKYINNINTINTKAENKIPNNAYTYICTGLNIIQTEIKALENRIDIMGNNAPKMFYKKIESLVKLGNLMLEIKNLYEFNRR